MEWNFHISLNFHSIVHMQTLYGFFFVANHYCKWVPCVKLWNIYNVLMLFDMTWFFIQYSKDKSLISALNIAWPWIPNHRQSVICLCRVFWSWYIMLKADLTVPFTCHAKLILSMEQFHWPVPFNPLSFKCHQRAIIAYLKHRELT